MVMSQDDLEWLPEGHRRAPKELVTVDVEKQDVRFGDRVIKATVPDRPRNQLAGDVDSTAVLLEASAAIEATARKLPYIAAVLSRGHRAFTGETGLVCLWGCPVSIPVRTRNKCPWSTRCRTRSVAFAASICSGIGFAATATPR